MSISGSLSRGARLAMWGNALAVSLIVLSELLVLDYAIAWTARGYFGGGLVTMDAVLIVGAAMSLLVCWRLLCMALRVERRIIQDPNAVELPV